MAARAADRASVRPAAWKNLIMHSLPKPRRPTITNAYPINVLGQIKACQEVRGIFCATANPLQVLVGKTDQGNGIGGVIDGFAPKGVEREKDKADRRAMLRKFGYKF